MPEATPLAMVTTSGTMPKRWNANGVPQRKTPVCTSSHMSSVPRSSVRRRAACRNSGVHGCTPPSPCTHSTMTAQISWPRSANRASSAATSFSGVWAKPSGSGWKASCLAGWAVAASVAMVRPWKLRSSVTTTRGAADAAARACASARLRACRRASLMAHSLASAPEFAKKLCHGSASSGAPWLSRSERRRATSPRPSI